MKHSFLKTTFTALIALGSTSAFAADFVINGQINIEDVISTVDISVPNIGEHVKVNGTAFGNNFVVQSTTGELTLESSQDSQTDNIISTVNINVAKTPLVDVSSSAIANRLIVVSKGAGGNHILNAQGSAGAPPPPAPAPAPGGGRPDPLSDVNINVDVVDEMKVASQAGGNMAQFLLEGTGNSIESAQTNSVMNQSLVDITANAIGTLDVTSAAFGNSLTLVLGELPETN